MRTIKGGLSFNAGGPIISEDHPFLEIMNAPAQIIDMLKEAKEKHMPLLMTNDDETEGWLIKDANDITMKFSIGGVFIKEI